MEDGGTNARPTQICGLSYFVPEIREKWPKETQSVIAFILGFTTAAGVVSFVSNFFLKQYNSYLEWDLSLAIELVVVGFGACNAAAVIAIAAAFVKQRLGHLQFPGRAAMLAIGAIYAAMVTLPGVIDTATTRGPFDDSGNPPSHGWGATVGCLIFITTPVLLITWIWIRSLTTRRKADVR
jgi:hypothetical protein